MALNIIILGTGMYVTGRHNSGTGTILSSMAQLSKDLDEEISLKVLGRGLKGKEDVEKALVRINNTLQSRLKVDYIALNEHPEETINNICREKSFDGAIICVPDHLHYFYTKIFMENNLHCLVVKPLTPTLEEAEQLLKLQRKNNLHGVVEFHKRWDETNLAIKKYINEQKLGKILYFTVDYSQKISIPLETFKGWANKTNIFQYLGVHYVDLIYFLTDFKPLSVMALGTNGILKERGINTFDSIHTTIQWVKKDDLEETFLSILNTNWIDPVTTSAMSDQKYKVIGTHGRIECDQKNRGLELILEKSGIQHPNPYFSDYLPDKSGQLRFDGYGYKSIATFVRDLQDIKSGKSTPTELEKCRPSFYHSLISTSVIEAVNKSLEKGGEWVKL